MKLTPLDVKKQEFKKGMRGYDPVEVDAFLEMVADELESLIREKNNLADEALKLNTQLQDYKNVESTLKETLMQAQESVNESRMSSRREADLKVREAEMKAEKILEEAKLNLADMKNELVLIRAQKDSFARRLRHLLESQLELIGVLELDDLGFESSRGSVSKPKFRAHHSSESKREQASESKYEQEKIEFGGVEDILPEQTILDQEDSVKPVRTDDKPINDLSDQENPDSNQDDAPKSDNAEERKSRISDHLIF